jgi:DNA polymerase-3 subunit beta
MKIQILQENLLKALGRTGRIISAKTQLPVLQNVLIKTEGGMLRVTSTNMESSVSSLVGVKEDEGGGVCVSARLLNELITSMPQETITLEEKDGTLKVNGSKTHAILPSLPVGEFPPINISEEKHGVKIENKIFKDALSSVLFAAATDEGRPILTGVRINQEDGELMFAATDGYRLSVKKVQFGGSGKLDLVLPARALSEVLKVISEEKDEKETSFGFIGEGQAVFTVGDTKVITRTIDGEYPDFKKIIPKTHTTEAILDAADFARAVKSASIFARDNANIVKIHISKPGLTASANTPQVGQNTVEVDAEVEGEEADIAFNSRFLTELLSNYQEERLVFQMTGSLSPGLFKPVKDSSFLHIIMPVRVQS